MRRECKQLIVVIALAALASCDESPKVPLKTVGLVQTGADKPSQVSYNTSMNFSSDGMLRAILHAGRVDTYEQKRYTWLDSGVRVDFYDRRGEHSSILTSISARINSTTNDMTAYGKVHIVSDSGTKVDTDSLEWKNDKQTLHSDSHVHIVERNGRITDGLGFESDQSLEHYHILRPVIVAPSESLGARNRVGSSGGNDLKPVPQAVPGEGAMKGEAISLQPVLTDTTAKVHK